MTVTLTPAQRAEERAAENAARWHVLGFDDGAVCEKHWPRPAGQPDGYKRARLRCIAVPVGTPLGRVHTLALGDIIDVIEER